MPAMKREAIRASIRSQLMNDPQNGILLLLNTMKLFADRKDDAEFVRELADMASDLAMAVMESPYPQHGYPQTPLFNQPPLSFPDDAASHISNIPSVADYHPMAEKQARNQDFQQKLQTPPKSVADDAVSALNELGQDTSSYQNAGGRNEPLIQGYTEWTPKQQKPKK